MQFAQRLLDAQAEFWLVEPIAIREVWHGHFDNVMEVMPLRMVLQRAAHHPAGAVLVAGMEEVDAEIERPMDGGDGFLVVA